MRRALALAVTLAAVACPAAALAEAPADEPVATPTPAPVVSSAPVIGISDNKPDMFADPLFADMGVRHARLIAPYDAAINEPEIMSAWLDAALAAGIEPHVAFQHRRSDRCPERPCHLPPLDAYRKTFRAFRKLYPQVRSFTAWNEANHKTQPTFKRPDRAAGYYRVARSECPDCTIVAADVLGDDGALKWIGQFRAELKVVPKLWGLHNYADVNDGGTAATDAFLAAVPGQVWLTETGGIVGFLERTGAVIRPFSETGARKALQRLVALLEAKQGRVTRAYVYHWNVDETFNRFDAGLVRADGSARPGYAVLRNALRPDDRPIPYAAPRRATETWTSEERPELPVKPRVFVDPTAKRLRDGIGVAIRCVSPSPCSGRVEIVIGRRIWTGNVRLRSGKLGRIAARLPRRVTDRRVPSGTLLLPATVRMSGVAVRRTVRLAPAV